MAGVEEIVVYVVDMSAQARELFGEKGAAIVAGRVLRAHDYRFALRDGENAEVTMHAGATAESVVAYLQARGKCC